MTVSMPTTRLSSVMTGCGGKLTTCSRRSINGRMRSTNGTRMVGPGGHARWKRPSRSMIPAVACGTMRTVRMTVMRTKTAITATAMSAAVIQVSLGKVDGKDDGGRTVDLCDIHGRTGRDDVGVVVRAGAPDLA